MALKRSMSFMQDMDYTLQAAILGDEDLIADIPPPEIIPIPVESAKKSKKQPVKVMKEVIRYFKCKGQRFIKRPMRKSSVSDVL